MPLTNRERATELRAQADALEGVVSALLDATDELLGADEAEVPPAEVALVGVKIITNQGGLSSRTYTYTYHRPLPVGTVVALPVKYSWQGDPLYGVVQNAYLGPNRGYREILKVQ